MTESIIQVPSLIIDSLYRNGKVELEDIWQKTQLDLNDLYPNNGYTCFRSGSQSALVWIHNDQAFVFKPFTLGEIEPRNLEQKFLSHALTNPQILMATVIGPAGSGKTLLTLAAAIDQVLIKRRYEKIVITKPRTQVTDDDEPMGEVPGTFMEKMEPQLLSYISSLKKIWGGNWKTQWEQLLQKGKIEVIPLEHMRGVDISNAYVICDEAQNAGFSQYKTLTTRINESSKLVCMGDINQIDKYSNLEKPPILEIATHPLYFDSDITSLIMLEQVERGPLTSLIVKILDTK